MMRAGTCALIRKRQACSELKRQLAQEYPLDIQAYVDGKDAYVKALEQRALQWYSMAIYQESGKVTRMAPHDL